MVGGGAPFAPHASRSLTRPPGGPQLDLAVPANPPREDDAARAKVNEDAREREEFERDRDRADELTRAMRRHNALYRAGKPEISDAEYDALFAELAAIEARRAELRAPDSPTRQVGAAPGTGLEERRHEAPMLSLDSSESVEVVERLRDRARDLLAYVLEPKIDGVSLELVYLDGTLDRGVTRGDGRVGEDVTRNARSIQSVPRELSRDKRPAPSLLAVRGEVFMRQSRFKALNRKREEAGEAPYKNARNATAGALRTLDSARARELPLELAAFEILKVEGSRFDLHREALTALEEWGFQTPEGWRVARAAEEIEGYRAELHANRMELDFEIDGVVAKLDRYAIRELLGETAHHPRWAVALKFEAEKATTRILGIETQVGRSGVLTPKARVEPTDIGGVTVSHASLHNRELALRKDVRPGDRVWIQRAGDVIPQILERIPEEGLERAPPFRMPERCPECESDLTEDGPRTVCPNRVQCPGQLRERIEHYASRRAMRIDGMGEAVVRILVERFEVQGFADIYRLRPEQLAELSGWGEKSAGNLVRSIQSTKRAPLDRFLTALGIPGVGSTVAGRLARRFGDLDRLRRATKEELEEVELVGAEIAASVLDYFSDPALSAQVEALLEAGVEPQPVSLPMGEAASGPLHGAAIALTGIFQLEGGRAALRERLLHAGARATSGVTKATRILVTGEKPGKKKLAAAKKIGTEVLDESSFLARYGEALAISRDARDGASEESGELETENPPDRTA